MKLEAYDDCDWDRVVLIYEELNREEIGLRRVIIKNGKRGDKVDGDSKGLVEFVVVLELYFGGRWEE